MEQRKNSKFLRCLSWGIAILGGALLFWGAFVEPNRLVIRRSTLHLPGLAPGLEGVRVLLVADTHFGNSFIDRMRRERLVKYAAAEKADLCFLLGDYIAVGSLPGYGAMPPEELTAFFSALKAPLGNYAVLGNHELWYGRKKMTGLLEKGGFQMIENKVVKIKDSLFLAGIPDGTAAVFDTGGLNNKLKKCAPLILLSHKGGMLKFLKSSPATLMFAADTHGGQVRIPGVSSLGDWVKGKKELRPGISERWGRQLFITTGAGGHRIGFRLFCPPEIAVVTLKNGKQNKI
ncbi:MAG: metallophosphoesterase [Lentisphaeria bacterium]|nr:metallophosphoesterase [Lentisphaeria bacterium]